MNKLFLFNNGNSGIRGMNNCYSISSKGVVLGNHICSDDSYMKVDLHDRPDRWKAIQEHFDGEAYELVIVPTHEVDTHAELDAACKLSEKLAKEGKLPPYEKPSLDIQVSNNEMP